MEAAALTNLGPFPIVQAAFAMLILTVAMAAAWSAIQRGGRAVQVSASEVREVPVSAHHVVDATYELRRIADALEGTSSTRRRQRERGRVEN